MNYALVGASWGYSALERAGVEFMLLDVPREIVMYPVQYVFCLNWSRRVPQWFTDAYRVVNFHATRLPAFRGGHPIENLILAGHTDTVITAHRMTDELDAGPIYGVSAPISLAGTKVEIQQRFVEPVAELIRYIVKYEPEPKPQMGKPTYFKRLSPEAYAEFWRARG